MAGFLVASGVASAEAPASAQAELHQLITKYAVPDPDPWLSMHVVLALGAEVRRGEVPILASAVSDALRVEELGMRRYPFFPLDVERHRFHFVQILQAIDLPREHVFVTPVGRWTHAELTRAACELMDPAPPASDEDSWAVSVLSQEFPPARDSFINARGERIEVGRIVAEHVRATEAAYAVVYAAMQGGSYRRNALHQRVCNGLHLLYGVIEAGAAGYEVADLGVALPRMLDATLFRARLEDRLVDLSFPAGVALAQLNADAARLTFLGHLAEDFGRAAQLNVFVPGPAQREILLWVRTELSEVVLRLARQHDLAVLAERAPAAWKALLGDLCHASRGFELLPFALRGPA